MELAARIERVAAAAAAHADDGERVAAVLPAEPRPGELLFLCAFEADGDARSWLVVDAGGEPVRRRDAVRDAVSIAALCEIAAETAAGGDLDELHAQLVALRMSEQPPGIDAAEEAVLELQRTIGAPPHLASPERLDAIGAATRRLEVALGETGRSPFAEAMKAAGAAVEALAADVEAAYRLEL